MNKCNFCDYCDELKLNPFYSQQTCALQESDRQREIECKKAEEIFKSYVR